MRHPEYEPENTDTKNGIRAAIEQTITDPVLALRASHEMAADDPVYALEASRVAFDLFPEDPDKRDAFLSGTELRFLQNRQVAEANALELLLDPATKSPTVRRRWLGTKAALLAVGLFSGSRRPNHGGDV